MNRDYLLIEDECAPDARDAFDKDMQYKYNLSIKEFKTHGVKTEYGYKLRGYCLEKYPDAQQWHLFQCDSTVTKPTTYEEYDQMVARFNQIELEFTNMISNKLEVLGDKFSKLFLEWMNIRSYLNSFTLSQILELAQEAKEKAALEGTEPNFEIEAFKIFMVTEDIEGDLEDEWVRIQNHPDLNTPALYTDVPVWEVIEQYEVESIVKMIKEQAAALEELYYSRPAVDFTESDMELAALTIEADEYEGKEAFDRTKFEEGVKKANQEYNNIDILFPYLIKKPD